MPCACRPLVCVQRGTQDSDCFPNKNLMTDFFFCFYAKFRKKRLLASSCLSVRLPACLPACLPTYIYICELNSFDVMCNASFKEHLPEDGHNRWTKDAGGQAVHNAINLQICICTCWPYYT